MAGNFTVGTMANASTALFLTALAVFMPLPARAGVMARPAPGARDVSRTVTPGWHFDRAEAVTAARDGRLVLRTPLGTRVHGIVRLTAFDAVFEPEVPLAACTRYHMVLRDAARRVVARAGFTTQCSAWSAPMQIDDRHAAKDPERAAAGVVLAANAPGGVVAAWFQGSARREGRRDVIEEARERARFADWVAPMRLDAHKQGPATVPALAADGQGAVIAVWSQVVGGRDAMFARRMGRDGRWGVRARLDDPSLPGDATAAQVGADGSGAAVAWQQSDGRGTRIEAVVGSAERGWAHAHRLDGGVSAYAPAVAPLGDGRFVVAWEQARPAGVYAVIWGDGVWSTPRRVSARGHPAHQPVAVGNGRGGGALAWVDGTGATQRIAVARLDGDVVRRIDAPRQRGGAALAPALMFDPAGNLLMAWGQDNAAGREGIAVALLRAGKRRWDSPTLLDATDQRSAGQPVLGGDAAGNLACAWYQDGPLGLQVWVARGDASSGRWTQARMLSDPRATVQATLPAMAVDPAGGIAVAWQQFNNWRDVVMAVRRP